jgi:hypothetical protein
MSPAQPKAKRGTSWIAFQPGMSQHGCRKRLHKFQPFGSKWFNNLTPQSCQIGAR